MTTVISKVIRFIIRFIIGFSLLPAFLWITYYVAVSTPDETLSRIGCTMILLMIFLLCVIIGLAFSDSI